MEHVGRGGRGGERRRSDGYDADKLETYVLLGDKLGKLECSADGGYAAFDTAVLGTFIVCERGTAFYMPMWARAVLLGVGVLAVAAIVVLVIVLVRRSRRKNKDKK